MDHEKVALAEDLIVNEERHTNLVIKDSGLAINPAYLHLGTSPDGCITCDCCGVAVIEIKCPFSCADQSFKDTSSKNSFCLNCLSDGSFALKKTHTQKNTCTIIRYKQRYFSVKLTIVIL